MTEPYDLVHCAAGIHFGQIDDSIAAAVKCAPGPICLTYGIPGAKGFGLLHIEGKESRIKHLQGLGFQTLVEYAHFVCQSYDWIIAGERDRLILVRSYMGYDCTVIVQLSREQDYWAIVTALPKRQQRGEKLWEKVQAGGSEPTPSVVEKRRRFETLTLPKKP